MKVLFVNPPHAGFDRDLSPKLMFSINRTPHIGILSIAAYLRQYGYEVFMVDGNREAWRNGNIRALTYTAMLQKAKRFNPDLICVTILTADFYECFYTVEMYRDALPDAVIVAGGPHPSGAPEATLQQIPKLDGVGIGPGEEICLDLAKGKSIEEVANCAFLEKGEAVYTQKKQVSRDIDRLPFPAFDLLDTDFYCELNLNSVFGFLTRSLPVLTGRGCPRNCFFCSSKWNRPLRTHSIQYIINLCNHLVDNYPIDTIAFWDDLLGMNANRLQELCEQFIESGLTQRVQWSAQLRADGVEDLDLLKLMREAGCIKVSFGAESGSDTTLQTLRKGTTVAQNEQAVTLIEKAGMACGMSLMLGVPCESLDDMKATFNFIKRHSSAHFGVGRFCPLPGSPAYVAFVEIGLLDPKSVDWEGLGNFSVVEGTYYGTVPVGVFQRFMRKVLSHIARTNKEFFFRHNEARFPEVCSLYRERWLKGMLRRVISGRVWRVAKKAVG